MLRAWFTVRAPGNAREARRSRRPRAGRRRVRAAAETSARLARALRACRGHRPAIFPRRRDRGDDVPPGTEPCDQALAVGGEPRPDQPHQLAAVGPSCVGRGCVLVAAQPTVQRVGQPVVGHRDNRRQRQAQLLDQHAAAEAEGERASGGHSADAARRCGRRCRDRPEYRVDRYRVDHGRLGWHRPAAAGIRWGDSRRPGFASGAAAGRAAPVQPLDSVSCRWSRKVPVDRLTIRPSVSVTVASA